ncbi:hypothetical protein FHR20_002292 [Sphingomonas leidyi]|uniref:Uncharacterized protein n=1 Tax=Sphingomonas leidyi TaxID=68569 RepID=A0A7X5UZX2_9SPHN|nr:hypothetical protein [Sphingomonas leidyi]NIJ65330.1 hypothetical protein [Sphingomonas leidyi]
MPHMNLSRRTTIAATDVLEEAWYQSDVTAFLMELGPAVYTQVRSEPVSKKNRLSDLKRFVNLNPGMQIDGESIESLLVERAARSIPPEPEHSWSKARQLTPLMATFLRVLELDGFTVSDGVLRRVLPSDIGLPETESDLMRLLAVHGLGVAKGHLIQAIDAHARGNWAGANGQIRTFLDALLDGLAERVDPDAAALPTGQSRRAKLAASGFLSRPLNEWSDDGKGFVNGLVKRLHPEGPHPGLSDEDDSTFRLHTVLLTSTLLLRRYDKGPV